MSRQPETEFGRQERDFFTVPYARGSLGAALPLAYARGSFGGDEALAKLPLAYARGSLGAARPLAYARGS